MSKDIFKKIKPYSIALSIFLILFLAFRFYRYNEKQSEIPIIEFLLAALISFIFFLLLIRRKLIEESASSKTKELERINRLLKQEIQDRIKIENDLAKNQDYLQKRHEALEYLTKLTTTDPQFALNEIIIRTASVLQIERTCILFYEEENESPRLICIGLYLASKNAFANSPDFTPKDYPEYFNTVNKHSHLIFPSSNDALNQELWPYTSFYNIQSKLDIPIVFEGKLLGVLCCEETRENRRWLLEDRHFGQTIADVIAIMIEQSGRRKAENALQASEERLRFITKKAIDGIVSVTETGKIISWNYGAETMFGYLENEIIGKPLKIVLTFDESEEQPDSKPIELKGKHKSGKSFPVEVSHTKWKSGSLYFETIIIRDITERKEYEKKLLKAVKEAKAANQAKSEFLTTISHELRTPLNAIIGFNQILLMEIDGPINELQRMNLKKIEKSSFALLNLINNLLDLAKIEANKMELEITSADIREIIASCLEEVSSLAQQKGLRIDWSEKTSIMIEMDKMRIRQVISNLLSNAIKFTDSGHIRISVKSHHNTVEIQINDTGIGLTSEEMDKIFKPFSQADSSITRKFGGTGLGLAISKRIIDLHRGTITVESEKNKGSLFIIFLPKVHS